MTFRSILFEHPEDISRDELQVPSAFHDDLNMDQIVSAVSASRQGYDVAPIFQVLLSDAAAIQYRQDAFRDLEDQVLIDCFGRFAAGMRTMRERLVLAEKSYYQHQKNRWFLDVVHAYCQAANGLAGDLDGASLNSRAMVGLRRHLSEYLASESFTKLVASIGKLQADLDEVRYCVTIYGGAVTVQKYASEMDYSAAVSATFERFNQGAKGAAKAQAPSGSNMNDVEARVLACVARLYPELFSELAEFCGANAGYLDATVARLDREAQFYLGFLEFIRPMQKAGLPFCYPTISERRGSAHVRDGFDLALARKLIGAGQLVVCNDFELQGQERVLVVSGPNQGGKTTFARTFGQLHRLARLGCPVPGRVTQLFLFDRLFTHFERVETIENLRGKLQDDLVRISDILAAATPSSIIILNEIFTSTTLQDATYLSEKIMQRIVDLDCLCVWVTFIDELASFDPKTVSMVSTISPDDPASRTFKVVRKPADGLSYALAIAEKHRVTYGQLKERLKP